MQAVEAILDSVKEGHVTAKFCEGQAHACKDQFEAIALNEDGSKKTGQELTEVEATELEGLMAKFDYWEDIAEKAHAIEKDAKQEQRMKALSEGMKNLGGIPDPEGQDPLETIGKALDVANAGDSQFKHLFGNEEFHLFCKANGISPGDPDADPVRLSQQLKSMSFKLGPMADFLSSKSVISTQPTAANSVIYDSNGEFTGSFYDWGEKVERNPDISILELFPTEVISESVVRYLERSRGVANVQIHQEVDDLANIVGANRKPYSALGPHTLHSEQLQTIAHLYVSTTEALRTWGGLEQVVNSTGRFELLAKLAAEVISGDPTAAGSTDVLTGLFNQSGINILTSSPALGGFAIDAPIEEKILVGRTAIRKRRFAATTAIVSAITGQRLAIEGRSYVNSGVNVFHNPITGVLTSSVHGVALNESEEVGDDDIAMGSFDRSKCALFTHGDPRVAFTDSHEDHFALNLVDWRFEMEALLGFKVPEAFVRVRLNA